MLGCRRERPLFKNLAGYGKGLREMPQVVWTSEEGDLRRALNRCKLKWFLEDSASEGLTLGAYVGSEASLSPYFLGVE